MLLTRKSLFVAALSTVAAFVTLSARADFRVDLTPDGEKFYNGDAQKDVFSFIGNVGGQHSGPTVAVTSVGAVDTGAGFSTIKPIKGGSLTSLIFTPTDGNLFDDFSFRGQLEKGANGTVIVTVQDNQGHAAQSFTFTGLGKNADFSRIGIEAVPGTGETIKSITLTSVFKEEKQNEFSFAAVPEPAFYQLSALLGLGGLGFLRRRRA
jgi:hypothetical protein